ncbi:5'-3' exoribonuclease 1 [Acanthopagrus latus]|uniref:5'-3' exoribonuclease 1 n=1 Tax=Acanthopagrus latus TaxID=8177 RepID=UPI00187CE989|nr:5'-3' exoribonuclease 1 [Acanthopagrus latus]XP_036939624.1 5'-3' exoribonuclease 1 [Acanthopagrus latus]XP_036939625.1 5'-3' exoribonuclease 1 [Acanthopagrus latus]
MGVPKFYRWISERYPCLSEVVKEHQIPEFDNLYLDMNGIIHQCSHPNDEDVHFRISEEKIFADIFHYLEVLFRIIKPRKVFFMAVDGVAPRAKMNQQRGRRFRSAKEAEDKIKKALDKGEVLPTEARFDSNCITPGTDFMARLQEQLEYFVHNKLSTDKLWQNVRVYLSGHETPGEGEHKIMEFIRSENRKPSHDPNTRHCLYGLDADLMMLGLTSHEPNFSLLREEVRFGGKKNQKRITAPEETTFHLLHLSLMREYIDYEFSELRKHIGSDYDLERIIDDWILMGFLVGNDFIPHLPHLHISHDALPLLYKTYISVLPSLGGYLNENGHLNLRNFEKYLEKLSEFDREHFSEVFVDLKWFESKVGNKYLNEAAGLAAEKEAASKEANQKEDSALCLAALTSSDKVIGEGKGDDEEEEDDMFETEFRQYKRTYYMTKMGVDVVSDEFLAKQARCYVEGIQWILHYYYHGVQSWSWYYPFHYAPFLSDIRNIAGLKLTFDLGKPFMPFQQLLAVLPAASMELLPQAYRHLMTNENSPIIEYYPLDFKTDLNGKQQEWEAVVLIPFIDERCLLAAMDPCNHKLTKQEKARNCHTECAVYTYDQEADITYSSSLPQLFPDIIHCHVRKEHIPMDAWHVPLDHVSRPFDRSSLYFCGFPTLQHIRHKFYKKKSGVVVFQQSSRGENTILDILPSKEGEAVCDDVATQVLGKSVFVNWPHLEEARVIAVSDGEVKFCLEEPPGVQKVYDRPSTPPPTKVTCLSDKEQKDWVKDVQGITEHFLKRKGIVVNETTVLLYGQLLTGRKYVPKANGVVELEKQWAKQVLPFAYQTVVKDIKAFYSSLTCFKSLDELFPPTTTVFMVGNPYYGAMGEVQDSSDVIKDGRVRVVFNVPHEPQLETLIQNQHKYCVKYSPGYVLASRLGITSYLVSRFSGSIFIGRGSKKNPCGEQKANVGLNLKFNKKNEEVPGYTKRTEKEWLYSVAVEELLAEYLDRFSEVFNAVSRNSHDDVFYEDDIWPGLDQNGAEKVAEITSWLKSHPVSSVSRTSCELQVLDTAIVERIEEAVEKTKVKKSTKKVRVTVKPHLLYRPLEQQQGVVPDPDSEYRLFDRVVNIRESFTVPLGLRGTIIGIKGAEREAEVLYEVLFDEEFAGGLNIRCTSPRGYRVPPCALINLSHGGRVDHTSHKLTAIVKPQPAAATSFNSQRQLGGLNHSPRSPFIPMQHNNKHSAVKAASQGNRNSPSKGLNQKQQAKSKSEYNNVWQALQSSGPPQQPPAHWHNNEGQSQQDGNQHSNKAAPVGGIRLLKKNEDTNCLFPTQNTANKATTEFEDLIASLKISTGNQQTTTPAAPPQVPNSQSEGPLSPQSFAMKGTLMLKEMLKIDSAGAGSHSSQEAANSATYGGQQQNRRRSSKKLAANMNSPHSDSPATAAPTNLSNSMLGSKVSELAHVCVGLGLAPPDFSFIGNRQGPVVCQVKLSNGLMVHGPQCQSENDAKERAAFFALQRLNSVGSGFPLPPPLYPGVGQIRPPPIGVFNQQGGLLLPPQGYPPAPLWGMPLPPHHHHHQSQPYYGAVGTFPGAARQQPAAGPPIGSHNQFIPLQVTKKRASANKKNQETREFYNASHTVARNQTQRAQNQLSDQSQSGKVDQPHQHTTNSNPSPSSPGLADAVSMSTAAPHTPPRQNRPATGHTPSSASKRKHRKLAVNFEAAKVSE